MQFMYGSRNKFTNIEWTFKNQDNLIVLDLSYNNLNNSFSEFWAALPYGIETRSSLQILDISNNSIHSDPSETIIVALKPWKIATVDAMGMIYVHFHLSELLTFVS